MLPRFAAFAVDYPVGLFTRDCDFQRDMDAATNDTWERAAPISTCSADLFADALVPDSKATVYNTYAPLDIQFNGSLVVVY